MEACGKAWCVGRGCENDRLTMKRISDIFAYSKRGFYRPKFMTFRKESSYCKTCWSNNAISNITYYELSHLFAWREEPFVFNSSFHDDAFKDTTILSRWLQETFNWQMVITNNLTMAQTIPTTIQLQNIFRPIRLLEAKRTSGTERTSLDAQEASEWWVISKQILAAASFSHCLSISWPNKVNMTYIN